MRSAFPSSVDWAVLVGLVVCIVACPTWHDVWGAPGPGRPVVALFDIEASGTFMRPGGAGRLSALMAARLRSRFDVVLMSSVETGKLRGRGGGDPTSCRDLACRVGLARGLNASKVLVGQAIDMGAGRCRISLELIDTRKGTQEATGSATGNCDEESLLGVCERATRMLLREEGAGATSGVEVSAAASSSPGPAEAISPIVALVEESGFLVIRTPIAGAAIRVDGREVGRSPLQLELKPGSYLVEADMGERYHPARRVVELTSAGARIELAPREAFGLLTVKSDPTGAEVRLDGRTVGTTPLIDYECAGGVKAMEVLLADYLTVSEPVEVIDGRTVERKLVLSPSRGTVVVESSPPGASVLLDGKDTGQRTPCTLVGLAMGRQKLALRLDGYAADSFEVDLAGGGTARVHRELLARQGLMLVLIEDANGGSMECPVMLDGNLVGLAPWKGTVQARPHDVSVECLEGRASQVVNVLPDERARVVLVVGEGAEHRRPAPPSASAKEAKAKEAIVREAPVAAEAQPYPMPDEPAAVPARTSWYRKWWPWAILGGAVLAGTGLALGLTLGKEDARINGTGRIDWR